MRLNLSDCIQDLHPPPPPCFKNRLLWVEYLQAAASCQNHKGEPKIIVIVNGEPAINQDFPYCEDCTQLKSLDMYQKGLCNPNYLKDYYEPTGLHQPHPERDLNHRPGSSQIHRISPGSGKGVQGNKNKGQKPHQQAATDGSDQIKPAAARSLLEMTFFKFRC